MLPTAICFSFVISWNVFAVGIFLVYDAHGTMYPCRHSDGFGPSTILNDSRHHGHQTPLHRMLQVRFDWKSGSYNLKALKVLQEVVLAAYICEVENPDSADSVYRILFDDPVFSRDHSKDGWTGWTTDENSQWLRKTNRTSPWTRLGFVPSKNSTYVRPLKTPTNITKGVLIEIRQEFPNDGPFLRYWVAVPASIFYRRPGWKGVFPFNAQICITSFRWHCPKVPVGFWIGYWIVHFYLAAVVGFSTVYLMIEYILAERPFSIPWVGWVTLCLRSWAEVDLDFGILAWMAYYFWVLALQAFYLFWHLRRLVNWRYHRVYHIFRVSIFPTEVR